MTHRTIENYQYCEEDGLVEDGIETYIANHLLSKLPYLLKKVSIQNPDKSKYKSLLNQVGILKDFNSPYIIQCHKMLKTPNNIYLVYDYCDGFPISQSLSSLTKDLKLSILNQLITVLKLLNAKSIIHCNMKPSSILLSNDNKIKLLNFTFAVNLSKNKDHLQYKPTISKYLAPEIVKSGVAHIKSDLYSFGIILEDLRISEEFGRRKGETSPVQQLIQSLKRQNPNSRAGLDQVQEMLKQLITHESPEKSQNFLSPSKSIKKTKSSGSNDEKSSKKILSPASIYSESSRQNEKKFIEYVLKRRNFAIFLVQMSETCLRVEDDQKKIGLFISYLFMKKSCRIICGLLSFLKNQQGFENEIEKVVLNKNERAQFEKKGDFYKIISTIQKQAGNQKRWCEEIYKNVVSELSKNLRQIADEEEVSDKILRLYAIDFIKEVIRRNQTAEGTSLNRAVLEGLYLMSEITQHQTYDSMFEQMISEEKISLDEQYLYTHIRKQDIKELCMQLQNRLRFK